MIERELQSRGFKRVGSFQAGPSSHGVCEWDPEENAPGYVGDAHNAPADVVVGSNGEWHLCSSCAALPRFKRYRKRRLGGDRVAP
jgi:hypothetical protein